MELPTKIWHNINTPREKTSVIFCATQSVTHTNHGITSESCCSYTATLVLVGKNMLEACELGTQWSVRKHV